ncbi:hypothetical protein RJT34_02144 [Clitoria ternatea]|uniref:Uncharacterized protein n=1 Tax=Clitoria ternatea TaxID=43366 RepID=A0AAN9Q0T3_CLITE
MSCEGRRSTLDLVIGEGNQPRGFCSSGVRGENQFWSASARDRRWSLVGLAEGGDFCCYLFFFAVSSLFCFWLMETIGFGSMLLLLRGGLFLKLMIFKDKGG